MLVEVCVFFRKVITSNENRKDWKWCVLQVFQQVLHKEITDGFTNGLEVVHDEQESVHTFQVSVEREHTLFLAVLYKGSLNISAVGVGNRTVRIMRRHLPSSFMPEKSPRSCF